MGSPGEGIGVALNALRSDAGVWEGAADDLKKPKEALSSLTVTKYDVSMWAADHDLDETFNKARASIEKMIQQASEYFHKLGGDLRSAANQYERDDEEGRHNVQGAYHLQGDLYDG